MLCYYVMSYYYLFLNKFLQWKRGCSISVTAPSRPKKRTTFYLEPNLLQKFKEICVREGSPMTNKVEEWIRRYVQIHSPGNPQLLMTNYVNVNEPNPLRVLCPYCQGALSSGEVFCQRKGMWIPGIQCYSCKYNRLRK